MDPALIEYANNHHGVFTRRLAAEHGVSAKRIRGAMGKGLVREPFRGVLVFTTHPSTYRQRLAVATTLGAIASHRSAAHLHRFDGYERPSVVEVSVPHGRRLRMPGVVVHSWRRDRADDITEVDRIPCTSVPRTLAQLGAVEAPERVQIALDSALRSGARLDWIQHTLDRLRRPGVTGIKVLDELVETPNRVIGVESVLERRLVRVLVDAGLPAPVPQFKVVTRDGEFRADFAYPRAQLLIEAHSLRFHHGQAREDADMRRHLALSAAGYEVVYVTSAMLDDPTCFVPQLVATYHRNLAA